MKTVLAKFLGIAGIALVMLASCKKDGARVISNGGKPGALTASTTTPVLSPAKLTDPSPVITFSFTAPNFGFSAAVTNTLQIDATTDNWANPISSTFATNVLSAGYSTSDFNALLLKLNLKGGVSGQVVVRVMHSLGANVAPVYTNALTLTVTPFNLKSWVYTVGSFEGWNLAAVDSVLSPTSNGVYTGVFYFPPGKVDFLILPQKTNYNNKYATNDPTNTTSSTVAIGAPNNFFAPAAAGWFMVTLNVNANTISFTPTDFYSVIGDGAQGWGTDVPMKYLNDGSGTWTLTTQLVSTGSIKVRQDNGWSFSWGIPKAGSAGAGIAGTLNDSSNDNIPVPTTGTHTVTFFAPATAFGTTPPVTTTYTLQ